MRSNIWRGDARVLGILLRVRDEQKHVTTPQLWGLCLSWVASIGSPTGPNRSHWTITPRNQSKGEVPIQAEFSLLSWANIIDTPCKDPSIKESNTFFTPQKSQAKGRTFKLLVSRIQVQHPLWSLKQKILKSYTFQKTAMSLWAFWLFAARVATTLSKMHRQPSARTCPRLLKILLKILLWKSNAPAPTVAQIAFQVSNQRKEYTTKNPKIKSKGKIGQN